jgi:hypothetical protein
MRTAAVLALMLLLCVLPALPSASPEGASAREWTVSGPEDYADRTIYAEENITVAAGGKLSFDNVTLRFNSTPDAPLVLEVLAGGELVLRNSSLDTNGSGPYLVRALAGSKLSVSGCTIAHAGTCATEPALSGFLVAADLSYIDNSTFRDGAAGLWLWNCSPEIPDCQFLADGIGAVLDGSAARLARCRFSDPGGRDMLLLNGSGARASGTTLDASAVDVTDESSFLDICWDLSVTAAWDTGRPASGALVSVKPSDGPASLYQADQSGVAGRLPVRSATVTNAGLQHHGPFNISAESEGSSAWNVTDIDGDRDIHLTLDGTPPAITIDYPPEGAAINGTPRPASGTAWDPFQMSDQPGVSAVYARIDDGQWEPANGTGNWVFGLEGLPEGQHTLTARAWDLSGNSNQSSVRFEVDLTAPALAVWPPAGYLVSAQNLTVSIVTDGVTVLFNGTPVAGLAPGRPLEVNWSLETEGENAASVESLDAAGNTARATLLVVRDTTPPDVMFTSPPAFSVVNTTLTTVSGQSSDMHGIALVEWGTDRENWTRVNGTGEWSFPALLAEGQDTVYVRAVDNAGNAATAWLRIDVRLPDTTPPELRILYPEDGQTISMPEVEVTVRAADAGGVRSVQLSPDGSNWTNATEGGDWTGQLTLVPGNNTLRARAFDLSGNANSTAISVIYKPLPPDTTPPSLVVLYPPAGLKVTYGKLIVSGRASDPSGVASVELSTDGERWTPCVLTGEDWSGTVTLSGGHNTIRVRAADTAGNSAGATVSAVYERPAGPLLESTTLMLMLALVLLAVLALWLLVRARPEGGSGEPGDGEE